MPALAAVGGKAVAERRGLDGALKVAIVPDGSSASAIVLVESILMEVCMS